MQPLPISQAKLFLHPFQVNDILPRARRSELHTAPSVVSPTTYKHVAILSLAPPNSKEPQHLNKSFDVQSRFQSEGVVHGHRAPLLPHHLPA